MSEANYEVIEGVVHKLTVFDANVNYVSNAEKNAEIAGMAAILQAASGAAGAVGSAQAASDEGDPVDGFAMKVGNEIVRGSFWKTTFKNGDLVRAIGSRHEGIFQAVAVASPTQRIVWMQPHCERGTLAQKRRLLRNSVWVVVATFALSSFLFTIENMEFWFYLLNSMLGAALILVVTVWMSWGDFMAFASQIDRVGLALGIESPENIDLAKSTASMVRDGKPELPMGTYYY